MKNTNKEVAWLLKEKYPNLARSYLARLLRGHTSQGFNKDVERLKAGEPLAYVIGFTDFLGCNIDLSKKPLIPRVETEFWVEQAIKEIKNRKPFGFAQGKINNRLFILDIFSGSGCIGVAILQHMKNAKVTFVEKDRKLLEQININCKLNNIDKKRYITAQSDIFNNVKRKPALSGAEGFDYIFANPPYIPTIKKSKIQKSVLQYEPKKALFGGKEGLFYIRKFLAGAKNFLNPNGRIFMEFDSFQKREIEKLLKKYGYQAWEFHKDQYKRWRWVIIWNKHYENRTP